MNSVNDEAVLKHFEEHAAKDRDARITAIVLGMIALFLFAGSCVLFGMGTLPPTALMGLGMLPYLGGAFLNFLALGVFAGTVVFGVIAAVHTCQKDQWQGIWEAKKSPSKIDAS